MPQTTNSVSAAGGHFHAVRFYEDSDSLVRMVADFLGEGLVAGEPALAMVTPEHRAALVEELRRRRFDVDQMQAAGSLLILDARQTLSSFVTNGELDGSLFRKNVMAVIDRLCHGRKDRWFRAYGEIVDLLWQDGQPAAAIRLESLWNELQHTQGFAGLCGYAMGKFYTDAGAQDIHRHHTHVISTAVGPAHESPETVALSPEFPSALWHLNGLTTRPMRIAST
jgi:DcmR-like sensory protein